MARHQGHFYGCEEVSFDACSCEPLRYAFVTLITLVILVIQVGGGYESGSLGLFADSVHVALDGSSSILALVIVVAVRGTSHAHDIESAGMRWSARILLLGLVLIAFLALRRLATPHEIQGGVGLAAAVTGGALNVLQFFVQRGGKDRPMKRIQMLHIVTDFASSVVVCIGIGITWAFAINRADALASLVAVAVISTHAIPMAFGKEHHHDR